jgi:hypothetical protein
MAASSSTMIQLLIDHLNFLSESFPPQTEQVHELMRIIRRSKTIELNQRIRVDNHSATIIKPTPTLTPPFWHQYRIRRDYSERVTSGEESTTTLANIIATNELNLTEHQMFDVFRLLLEKRVDLAALDKTCYLSAALTTEACHNNPLKSLIVAAQGAPKVQELIQLLILSLKQRSQAEINRIVNNDDNFKYGPMSPANFLLRLGLEHFALQLYQHGAKTTESDLLLACASFGTTPYAREAASCIQHIIRLPQAFTQEDWDAVRKNLAYGSSAYMLERLHTLVRVLKDELRSADEVKGSVFNAAASIAVPKLSQTFESWCHTLPNEYPDFSSAPELLQTLVVEVYLNNEYVAQGLFSEYYRDNEERLMTLRITALRDDPELAQIHEALCKKLNALPLMGYHSSFFPQDSSLVHLVDDPDFASPQSRI